MRTWVIRQAVPGETGLARGHMEQLGRDSCRLHPPDPWGFSDLQQPAGIGRKELGGFVVYGTLSKWGSVTLPAQQVSVGEGATACHTGARSQMLWPLSLQDPLCVLSLQSSHREVSDPFLAVGRLVGAPAPGLLHDCHRSASVCWLMSFLCKVKSLEIGFCLKWRNHFLINPGRHDPACFVDFPWFCFIHELVPFLIS